MKNLKRKSVIIMLVVILILSAIQNLVYGMSSAGLYVVTASQKHLQYYNSSNNAWNYVVTDYIGYDYNGTTYPAYCLNRELGGVTAYGDYDVDIVELISDNQIWRTIVSGFPYKSASQLGLSNDLDAYTATKHAVYSIIYERDVRAYYKGATTRGELIVDVIEKLVEEGRNGTATQQTANVSVTKSGSLYNDGDYYIQEYKVSSNVNIDSYYITSTAKLPTGTKITDTKGVKKTSFSNENFRIMIHKDEMGSDVTGIIGIQAKCETYPIFYGMPTNSKYQDYALTFDPLGDESTVLTIDLATNNSQIEIFKVDGETKEPISGVKFEVRKQSGELVGTYTTNSNGKITIENLYEGTYIAKEIETNENYILDTSEHSIKVEYGKTTSVTISNNHKQGNIKVIKVDLDDNEVKLENVEFDLIDASGKKVGNYITNENGEIYIEKLNIGTYKLVETKTNEIYELGGEVTIVVEWDKITSVVIENEKMKGTIEVIKVDLDDNKIKIEGVEFEVYNSDNKLVETIITDENGSAQTTRLPIGEYTLIETKTHIDYVLNTEEINVVIKRNEVTNITVENEMKKGEIEIIKVSKDDNLLTDELQGTLLENATFEIYNEKEEVVDILITNEIGYAKSIRLPKGIYLIKEVQAPEYYLTNGETFIVEIIEDKDILEVVVENESVKIDIDIEKKGFIETQNKDNLFYDFSGIINNSNVPLDNFTWNDTLPIDALRINRIYTGTWNEVITYEVWYKTNTSDFKLFKEELSTQINNLIDFKEIELEEDEIITEFEFRFGTVKSGFTHIEQPILYCDMLEGLPSQYVFTNYTKISGNYKDKYLEEKDEWTTITYFKELEVKEYELPRTGY